MRYLSVVLAVLFLAGTAVAADIDGTWSGELVGLGMQIEFKFKAEGDKLTGSHIISGEESKIEKGKIDGDKIEFTVTNSAGTFDHKGTVTKDEITMTYTGSSEGEIKVKKVKEEEKAKEK